jgi:hypothetical protein
MAHKTSLDQMDPCALYAAFRLMGFESTPREDAIFAAIQPLIKVTDEIGVSKPVSEYSYSEGLRLIRTIVDAYEKYLQENDQPEEEGTCAYVA